MSRDAHLRQAEARIGEKAGKYTLQRVIDVGGMAAVYAAKRWRTWVAVKVMHKTYLRMEEARVRFARESYVANLVEHPAVVRILDDGLLDDGAPFFVMDLLAGQSLEQRLEEVGVLPLSEVVEIAETLLDVLSVAHAVNVVHRDIKPANVFLTVSGELKLLDFGLARLHDGGPSKQLTRTGTVIGTAHYMSPEQAQRKHDLVDPRTDLWSLGAIVFRCLTGRTVHDVQGTGPSLIAAATNRAPRLASALPGAPEPLCTLVDKALAFDKHDRWSDADAMLQALREVDPSCDIAAPPPAPPGESAGDSIVVSFEDD